MNNIAIYVILAAVGITIGIIMSKLSEVKADVAEARKNVDEANAEIRTRLADQQKQIDDLIAGASDPEVTDETFLENLRALKTGSKEIADIVPGSPTTPTP